MQAHIPKGVTVVTTIFEDLGDQTRFTLRIIHSTVKDSHQHEEMGVIASWSSSFDCMDEYLVKF